MQSVELSPSNHAIMQILCALFAVFGITEYAGEFTMVTKLDDTSVHDQRAMYHIFAVLATKRAEIYIATHTTQGTDLLLYLIHLLNNIHTIEMFPQPLQTA